MKAIACDIETFSSIDLARSGVYRYAQSPDFGILLFGYSVDGGSVQVVDLAAGEPIPAEVLDALTDESIIKTAHNANFERVCLSRYLSDLGISLDPAHDSDRLSTECARFLNPRSWRCTMVWSAYMGLPFSLEDVGAVLGLEKQKLSEGKELIRYFCKPCEPSLANGGRARNRPEDAPEKWALFKTYNKRDVETEMEIEKRLSKFPVPGFVWDEYCLSEEINDRGIAVDMQLVENAIRMDDRSRTELTEMMQRLTNLDNPNSVQQMKQWLMNNGVETESLGKKQIQSLLQDAPPQLRDVLLLRQQLARSSMKKYTAMKNAVCADGRVRGMFQFYGASRTGRYASKIINLQNLPQNHMPDLNAARGLVRVGDYDTVKMLYGSVPDVLSELIRTAFIPRKGMKFIVADFSAIEARVIAWLAGEQWRLDLFERGGDIYCQSASQMFKVPVEKHGVNGHLRQKGKIAELACIARGEPVLTDRGLVPIEEVSLSDRLWDGETWVTHDGVVERGTRSVITYNGLTATPDHWVWVYESTTPIPLLCAAVNGLSLVYSGPAHRKLDCFHYREMPVFDILNAGPRHRFTVSGHLAHNCGYGGSVGALKAMGALEMGLQEDELGPLVKAFPGGEVYGSEDWQRENR